MELKEVLSNQIVKLGESLETMTVGTPEYDKASSQLLNLSRAFEEAEKNENKRNENALKERELDQMSLIEKFKSKIEIFKILLGVLGPILGLMIYRACFDKTGDPFFKDFGRSLVGLIRKS